MFFFRIFTYAVPFYIKYLKIICTHFTIDLLLANNEIKRFYICLNEVSNDFHSLYVSYTNKEVEKYCSELICRSFKMSNSSLYFVEDTIHDLVIAQIFKIL